MSESLSALSSNLPVQDTKSSFRVKRAPDDALNKICGCCVGSIFIALFVIGAVAAAGHMSGVAVGGCAVGLSIPSMLACVLNALISKDGRKRAGSCCNAIEMLAIMIIGALGISGILPATTVGWVIVGPVLIGAGCICCFVCGAGIAEVLGCSK